MSHLFNLSLKAFFFLQTGVSFLYKAELSFSLGREIFSFLFTFPVINGYTYLKWMLGKVAFCSRGAILCMPYYYSFPFSAFFLV